MSCRIFRDIDTEQVTRVVAPNGADSKLYADALEITQNTEEALNIWSAAYIPSFKKAYGDWEGTSTFIPLNETVEPPIDVVMDFITSNNITEPLSVKEAVDVLKAMQKLGTRAEALALNLKYAFFDTKGRFVVDRDSLKRLRIYTEEEINNLMSYPSVRQQVNEAISKFRNSLKEDVSIFNEVVVTEDLSDHPLLISTDQIDALGRFETLPIYEVENYLVNSIGQFVSEEEFQNKLNSLEREDIRDAVLNNPEAINYVRNLVQNLKSVPVLTMRDGIIVQRMLDDSYETLTNTVTVNVDKLDFTRSIDQLRLIPDDMWIQEAETVQSFLKDAEIEAARVGLDLDGLSAQYFNKSKEEVIGFLDLVDDFNVKTEDYYEFSDSDIVEFAQDINEFFNKEENPELRAIAVPTPYRDKPLMIVDYKADEVDLYRTNNLIKVVDNIYQHVESFQNYGEALEAVYEALLEDVTILPKEAFNDFGLKQGYYDVKAIVNPVNKEKVKNSINSFVVRNTYSQISLNQDYEEQTDVYDTNKEITLMKALYNPVQLSEEYVDDVGDRAFSFTGDFGYLTSDFITDFYTRMLEEKVIKEKSDLWNTALKYFSITNQGIEVKPLSADVLNQIRMALQSEPILYSNLVNYALISKSQTLDFLREFREDTRITDIQSRRDFAINNPDAISPVPVNYVGAGRGSIIVQNFNEEFTKTYDGILELTSSDNGVSVYSPVFGKVDQNYYIFGESSPRIDNIDAMSYLAEIPSEFIQVAHNVPTKTIEQIEDQISCII